MKQGAMVPLLSACCRQFLYCILFLALIFALTSCNSSVSKLTLHASGYTTDTGVTRIWRKEDNQHRPIAIESIFTPHVGHSVLTRYDFLNGLLIQIDRKVVQKDTETEQLRFDAEGKVTFMQRQWPERREMLSKDDIAKLSSQAKQLIEMSDYLNKSGIQLKQGKMGDDPLITCSGQKVKPNFDEYEYLSIKKQLQTSNTVGIAWLESPSSTKLLLVAADDICQSEPTIDTL